MESSRKGWKEGEWIDGEKIVSKKIYMQFSRNNFDDTDESITKRIDNYNQKTRAVAQKFNAKVVNAERTSDDIFADIQKILDAM